MAEAADSLPLADAGARADAEAQRIIVGGRVQGVGYRPFVYCLAMVHGISGHVRNRVGEVEVLACGRPGNLETFRRDLVERAPPLARPSIISAEPAQPFGSGRFKILASSADADARIFIPPDLFLCDDCRRELHDPADRRYAYPFINCTQCGPRYTLIEALPYDRPNTSMTDFPLCPACEDEYLDPADRRFHAEPLACPDCGPTLRYEAPGPAPATAPLDSALACLKRGGIVAVKGVGGYHLLCDARRTDSVATLRRRKRRPDKPLAIMFPLAGDDGLARVRDAVCLDAAAAEALLAPERPIVLAPKNNGLAIAGNVAPGLGELGVFLPYSPLHELLLSGFGGPLVATSGNVSGEPVLTQRHDAAEKLAPIADAFLHHNRRIVRPADDPVLRPIAGRLRPLRLGRGTAPLELEVPWRLSRPLLAVGGHMKGALALAFDDRVVISPHIGEMDSPRSLAVFEQVAEAMQSLYGVTAEKLACDAHPGYTTHRWAMQHALPAETVWHHRAHAGALAAERAMQEPLLAFAWDGVGLGEDGTLWGGEALYGRPGDWRRVASLRPFRLPGGERAGREPWRSAAALHWEAGLPFVPHGDPEGIAHAAWQRGLNCPITSSAGRLFDAAAALVLGIDSVSFEAAGPMRLESICQGTTADGAEALPLARDADGTWRSDWEPLLAGLADETIEPSARAASFHAAMARVLLDQARRVRDETGVRQVGLTGGVFQNRVLTELAVALLEADGFLVHLAERLPCNDAALCFGQVAEVAARQSPGVRHG